MDIEEILSGSTIPSNQTSGNYIYDNVPFNISILVITGFFVVLSVLWSLGAIILHLIHYNNPYRQKYIIRIIIMIPLYAVTSWISLLYQRKSWTLFVDLFRDCYEAYVIYIFFKLCVEFLGGVEATEAIMNEKPMEKYLVPFCCLKFKPGKAFYRQCLRNVIQYVIIRPTMTFSSVFLYYFGLFEEGDFNPKSGYLYVAIVNNISVCFALYYLALFYETMAHELSPHRPLLKFLCVKGIIFFTYWQSVVIGFLGYFNVFGEQHEMKRYMEILLNEGFICFEMFVAAIVHSIAFTHREYMIKDDELIPISTKSYFENLWNQTRRRLLNRPNFRELLGMIFEFLQAIVDATNQGDVVKDVVISTEVDRLKNMMDRSEDYKKFEDDTVTLERSLMDLDDKLEIHEENQIPTKEIFFQEIYGNDFFEADFKNENKFIKLELRVDFYGRIKPYFSIIKNM